MLLQCILEDKASKVKEIITERLNKLVAKKLDEVKKRLGNELAEANILKQGRVELIRRRIRNGKMQRNIRRPIVKGFTTRGGKLTRIPAAKMIRMKIVQKKAARKRRVKMAASLRKRKISLMKRAAIGLKEYYELRDHQ